VATVHARRVDEVVRDCGDDVLAHEEDAERGDEVGRDHRLQVVYPVQVDHLDVERDHAQLHRHEHRRDDRQHQRPPAAEAELREREPGESAEEHDGGRDRGGDDRRVDERGPEADVHLARVEQPADVVEELVPWREHRRVGGDGSVVVRRHDERPVEREQRGRRDEHEEEIGQRAGAVKAPREVPAAGARASLAVGDRGHGYSAVLMRRTIRKFTAETTAISRKRHQATADA
jgi:hypothetical protein